MNIEHLAKVAVDEISLNSSRYGVNIGFRSGPDTYGFALNPMGAKVLLIALKEQVEILEKNFGEIDISSAEKQLPSPFQPPSK